MKLNVAITETVTYSITISANDRIGSRVEKELNDESGDEPINATWFTQSDEAIIKRLIEAEIHKSEAWANATVEERTWEIVGVDNA